MFGRRTFLALCAAGSLAACAAPAPTESVLGVATRSNLQISQVTVDVGKLGERTKGRAVPAETVKAMMVESGNALLRGQGKGPRKARAEIFVDDVNIITAGQSIMVGGESTMSGRFRLVDAKTGQPFFDDTPISSGGGGWVGGGLVAVATRDDPNTEVRQMSVEFASRARVLVFGLPSAPKPVRAETRTGPVASQDDDEAARAEWEAEKQRRAERQAYIDRCRHRITLCE